MSMFQQEVDDCLASLKRLTARFRDQPPVHNPADPNGRYTTKDKWTWTDAFWPGQLWLAYGASGDNEYAEAALQTLPWFKRALADKRLHHDAGFMFYMAGAMATDAGYDDQGLATAGRTFLRDRYSPRTNVIPSWAFERGSEDEGRVIIDSLMTSKLLWWGNDPQAKRIGLEHVTKVAEHMIRTDGSSFHVGYFSPHNASFIRGTTHQGLNDRSTWARGQAWAVSGLTAAHRATGDPRLLKTALRCADYALAQPDLIPTYDYDARSAPVDTSAAAALADGLIDLAADVDRQDYRDRAVEVVEELVAHYSCATTATADGLIVGGCQGRQGPLFSGQLPYGDYYYLSALLKLTREG